VELRSRAQAIAPRHRIGRMNKIAAYRMIHEDAVEEK
jgi:SNF2 family DNA or RNA helicase